MEHVLLRTNTISNTIECQKSPLFQTLSAFFENSVIDAYIKVTKFGARKVKPFLIVLVITKENDVINSYLYQIKHLETGKQIFQIKSKHNLTKLRLVNGISEDEEEQMFELMIEKPGSAASTISIKCVAESVQEKRKFLIALWKLLHEQSQTIPQFLNVNYNMLQENLILSKALKCHQKNLPKQPSSTALEIKEYKYLTGEEEQDLDKETEKVDWSKENTQIFKGKLENELSGLDKANIHSIMSVESDVTRLFTMMDHALHEMCRLEALMHTYEVELCAEENQVQGVLSNYTKQQTVNNNCVRLLEVMEGLRDLVEFDDQIEDYLRDLPLNSPANITTLTDCLALVQEKRNKCQASPLLEMDIVKTTEIRMEKLLEMFKDRTVTTFLEIIGRTDCNASVRHTKLIPLAPVARWLHQYSAIQFAELVGRYQDTARVTYKTTLKQFFGEKRISVAKKSSEKLFSKLGSRKTDNIVLSSSKLKASAASGMNSRVSLASKSNTSLDSVASCKSDSEAFGLASQGQLFEGSFREALDFINKLMNREENFISHFFNEVRSFKERSDMVELVLSQAGEELDSYIEISCKSDIFYAIPIYLSLLDKLDDTPRDTTLHTIFRRSLDLANKFFNHAHKQQKTRILEVSKKSHHGSIADSVRHFTQYLVFCESLQTSVPRSSLATSYAKLADAVEEAIELFAAQSHKVPSDVIVTENYHYIYHFLFRNKIESLDKFRSRCHRKYKDHLEVYVKAHLGTPMENINQFFDGVQKKLNSGVRHEEIKKGLEGILKKIEKHFTKDPNLFKLACLSTQAEFVKQIEGYQELLRKCYPGSGIGFSFTITEVHSIFEGRSPKH